MDVRRLGPVMVASGCGGTGRELAAYAGPDDLAGLAFVTRTLTREPWQGHPAGPSRRVTETPGGLLNAVGLDNPGVAGFVADELPWLVRAGMLVVPSVAGASIAEHAEVTRVLGRAPGVAGLELNLSAPDQAGAGVMEVREPIHAAHLVATVRRELPGDLPLLAKLRPEVSRVVESARTALDAGATAVVLGNALPAAMPDGRPGGLSGPAVRPVALRCVAEVLAAIPGATVVGCGGVAEVSDARAFLDLGAAAVQVGTALLHDPTTLLRLRAGLTTVPTTQETAS